MTIKNPKITIIIPSHNSVRFIAKALKSVCEQSFTDIEVLVIDSSNDMDSNSVFDEVVKQDERVRIIYDPNSSYGHKINTGIDNARGEYISILESDDEMKGNMLEKLIECTEGRQLDFIKSDFIELSDQSGPRKEQEIHLYRADQYGKVIDNQVDDSCWIEASNHIWTGLYRKGFLIDNNIRLNETPGASYQDTGFSALCNIYAKKVFFINDCLYCYRIDNDDSSVKSQEKHLSIVYEHQWINDIISKRGMMSDKVKKYLKEFKLLTYIWNYNRLNEKNRDLFVDAIKDEIMSEYVTDNDIEAKDFFFDHKDEISILLGEGGALWEYYKELDTEVIPDKHEKKDIERCVQKGLLGWFDFEKGKTALFFGAEYDPIVELLRERELRVQCISDDDNLSEMKDKMDYIIIIGHSIDRLMKEYGYDFVNVLINHILPDGILFVGVPNPFGICYFCGENVSTKSLASISQYEAALRRNGNIELNRFSVFPRLEEATYIIADKYMPKEDLSNRITPSYSHPESVSMQERDWYNEMVRNDCFHQMANAYLYIVHKKDIMGKNGGERELQITVSMNRGRKGATSTLLYSSGKVIKKSIYTEGKEHIANIVTVGEDIKDRGICCVPMQLKKNEIQMPLINEKTVQKALSDMLLVGDIDGFLALIDSFRHMILSSSQSIECGVLGSILENAYFDMIPLNAFLVDGHFMVFDQECVKNNYPANVIICRMIENIYMGSPDLESLYPSDKLYERYGILNMKDEWRTLVNKELYNICHEKELEDYHRRTRVDSITIEENKARNCFGATEYQKVFENLFDNVLERRIYVFGAGRYGKHFLNRYSKLFNISSVIDNSKELWGKALDTIPICGPDILEEIRGDVNYKVIICMKDYTDVIRQLRKIGISEYSVYEPKKNYKIPLIRTS